MDSESNQTINCSCEQKEDVTESYTKENEANNVLGNEDFVSSSECSGCRTLEKKLLDEQKRCNILRENIHKVSKNWFHRKTQLSESEIDTDTPPVGLLDETTRIENADGKPPDGSSNSCADNSCNSSARNRDISKLVNIIAQKSAQLDLSDSQCRNLKKKMREYEKFIDDKESIIHGLKEQLESYLNDNQKMACQLNNLATLFQQLEKVDKESVAPPAVPDDDTDAAEAVPLPTQEDFQEMASSVSRTYIKLKDLIYEKKALVTEIERLNTLNSELQRRVVQQETRLMSVSDALHQTWLVVSDLKDQHAKLHDDELLMKYELKEKRDILTKLRRELESSRQQWQIIRQKNMESEQEYASIREMLQERRRALTEGEPIVEVEKEEPDEAVCLHPEDTPFDPPVDLLLEMGLEYGIIGEDAEMTQTVLDVIRGEDVRNCRLEQLEEHCSLLYTKLIASTSKSLFLASRLSRLHRQFGSSDEEDDDEYLGEVLDEENVDVNSSEDDEVDEDDDEEGEPEEMPYLSDANQMIVIESVLSSPISEEYDTAYVSETEGADAQIDNELTGEGTSEMAQPSTSAMADELTDNTSVLQVGELGENCDQLSRTLINFLPKKIEYLREENQRLQCQINQIKEDKTSAEENHKKMEKEKSKLEEEIKILTKEMTIEKLQKRQLEEQLKHLGKCVDELKLKRDKEKGIVKPDDVTRQKEDVDQNKEETKLEKAEEEEERQQRSEEERQKEDQRMKKDVELVKKEIELKKKEKELKRREEELNKRDKDGGATTPGCEPKETSSKPEDSSAAALESVNDAVLIAEVAKLVTDQLFQTSTTLSSPVPGTSKNQPQHQLETLNCGSKLNLLPALDIASGGSQSSSSEISISANEVIGVPVVLESTENELCCTIILSKEATLTVLQFTRCPVVSQPTSVSTSDCSCTVDSGEKNPGESTSTDGSTITSSILVPTSKLPAAAPSTITIRAKRPVTCVLVLKPIRGEEVDVAYTLKIRGARV